MINWIKTAHGVAAIVAAIFATMVAWWNLNLPRLVFSPELAPVHRRIEALEQFNRDTRLLVLDQARWRANSLGMLWAGISESGALRSSNVQSVAGGSLRSRSPTARDCC